MVLSKCRCRSLTQTTKDYASQSSIHGIGYIFDHKLGTWERVLWLMVVIAFLILATHLTLDTWTQWQEEQVVTTLKNTAKPVAEVPFPAVTICGTGNHMGNVEKKIQENFALWREENQRNKTGSSAMEKDVDDYMRETFQIHNKEGSDPVSILDILDTMIAPNVDASVAANGVRQNVLACQEEEPTQKSTSLGGREKREASCVCSNTKFTPLGDSCFYASSDKVNYSDAVTACQAEGGQLATIKDQAENEFVLRMLKGWSWIGLNDVEKSGKMAPYSSLKIGRLIAPPLSPRKAARS